MMSYIREKAGSASEIKRQWEDERKLEIMSGAVKRNG